MLWVEPTAGHTGTPPAQWVPPGTYTTHGDDTMTTRTDNTRARRLAAQADALEARRASRLYRDEEGNLFCTDAPHAMFRDLTTGRVYTPDDLYHLIGMEAVVMERRLYGMDDLEELELTPVS